MLNRIDGWWSITKEKHAAQQSADCDDTPQEPHPFQCFISNEPGIDPITEAHCTFGMREM